MFIEPNFSPVPGTPYGNDYASLTEHYSNLFGAPFDRPSATYWPHTLVPAHFHLKLLDALGFSAASTADSDPFQTDILKDVSPLAINLAVGGASSAYWPTMVMVQMVFPGRSDQELLEIARQLREEPVGRDLFDGNEATQALAAWGQKIAWAPQHLTRQDFEQICGIGLSAEHVVNLTQRASVQSHFAMGCSCAGADNLASANLPLRQLIGFEEFADGAQPNLTALPRNRDVEYSTGFEAGQTSWVPKPDLPLDDDVYAPVLSELGWVPNLFKAVGRAPEYISRHLHALNLLEKPQTPELKSGHHAMARLLTCRVLGSAYFLPTAKHLLSRITGNDGLSDSIDNWTSDSEWTDEDRAVLAFGQKIVCNAYKITQEDVNSVRSTMGWSDVGFADFMNTVAVQDSLCRLANALGVTPDDRPISVS